MVKSKTNHPQIHQKFRNGMHVAATISLLASDPTFEAKVYVSVLVRLQQLAATPGDALQHSPLLALLADCRNGVELLRLRWLRFLSPAAVITLR